MLDLQRSQLGFGQDELRDKSNALASLGVVSFLKKHPR